jgi:uncharacterized protein (DUF1501 family)
MSPAFHDLAPSKRPHLTRRDLLRLGAVGFVGGSASGWLESLAARAGTQSQRRRACILLWMPGGPSQLDTFDMKPGHAHGGPIREIATAVPGMRISEYLPKLAQQAKNLVLIRGMSTKEGDHGRALFVMRTGYLPEGPVEYPTLGALVANELGSDSSDLPNFVSIAPFRTPNPSAFGPGFLGPTCAPLIIGDGGGIAAGSGKPYEESLKVHELALPPNVTPARSKARVTLLSQYENEFVRTHPGIGPLSHQMAYMRAVRLMRSSAAGAFNLDEEPSLLRDAYGRNQFGQGCLLARRLVERGVPFVEVTMGGQLGPLAWDTHYNNFETVKELSPVLDSAWATLLNDLKVRGLLESTLIVWMGEFGRSPKITEGAGRDHYPTAWSTVLAGGGLHGGQIVGKTSADGMSVVERPVSVPDLLATVCRALGIDPLKPNISNIGRPIRIVDKAARPIEEILS